MKRLIFIILILVYSLSLTACSEGTPKSETKSITICAASSLREVLNEIKPGFEEETGIILRFNYGSSGTLQKQIEEGAPADIFISAGVKQMDALEAKGLIVSESRMNVLGNKLVLIVSNDYKGKIKGLSDLANGDYKISIGQPDTVPAGEYARQSLIYMKQWEKLQNKLVYAKDVAQVTAYVESGEAAAGIVYNSDAVLVKKSFVAQVFDEKSHKQIVYPAAIIEAGKGEKFAESFMEYLKKDNSQNIFSRYGFDINVK